MTLTRWKLMAGMLGLSIVGVVAVANPQCPNTKKDAAREVAPPSRVVAAKATESVIVSPPAATPPSIAWDEPAVSQVPPSALPMAKLPSVAQPSSPPALTPPALSVGSQTVPSIPPAVTEPALPKLETPAQLPAPKAEPSVLSELPNIKGVTLPNTVPDVGVPKAAQVVELPLPGVVAAKPVAPVPDLPMLAEMKPAPLPTPTVEPKLAPPPKVEPNLAPMPDLVKATPPVVESAPAMKVEAIPVKKTTATEDPAVRVMIHLGTGQPKFDVLAGDDVLLKAVCDNVDIRSPAEKGAGVTPLKAGGKVRFSAPGCEGTCDNLTVLPSSGEVELAGNVKVHCRMGKGETQINAATMKFKLGSAPAYAVPEPGVTSASFRDSK